MSLLNKVTNIPGTKEAVYKNVFIKPATFSSIDIFKTKPIRSPYNKNSNIKRYNNTIVNAESDSIIDIEAILDKYTKKFEEYDKKALVIAYGVAALLALFFVERIIHLPALDILLGFPIQLVGVIYLPYLILRYTVEKNDVEEDFDQLLGYTAKFLPGLNNGSSSSSSVAPPPPPPPPPPPQKPME